MQSLFGSDSLIHLNNRCVKAATALSDLLPVVPELSTRGSHSIIAIPIG